MSKTQQPVDPIKTSSDDDILTRIDELLMYAQQHKNLLIGVGAVIVIFAAGIFFYNNQKEAHNKKAAEAVAKILPAFRASDYNTAIYGDSLNMGLLNITESYSGTDFSDIANLYLGRAYYEKGVYDSALIGFEAVSSDAGLATGIALAGAAACYENQKEFAKAASMFKKAAQHSDNSLLKPFYFQSAARNFEQTGDISEAISIHAILLKEFSDSKPGQSAESEIARLKSLQAG